MVDEPIQLDDEIIPPEEEDETGEEGGGEEGGEEEENQPEERRPRKKRRREDKDKPQEDKEPEETKPKPDEQKAQPGAKNKPAPEIADKEPKTKTAEPGATQTGADTSATKKDDKKSSDSTEPAKPAGGGGAQPVASEIKPGASATGAAGAGEQQGGEGSALKRAALGVGKGLYDQAKEIVQRPGQIAKEIKNLPRTTARTARKSINRGKRWLKDPVKALKAIGRTMRMNLKGKDIGKGASALGSMAGSAGEGAKASARSVPGALLGMTGGDDQSASQATQAAYQSAAEAAQTPKKVMDTARTIYETPQRIRDTINAIKTAAKIAQQIALEAAKAAPKVAQAVGHVVKLLITFWPITLIVIVILIIVGVMMYLFGGGLSYIHSLVGGSVFVPPNPNNPAHIQMVENLQQKMTGCDPKLVIYDEGKGDIGWQTDEEGNKYHLLDIRLLKTLDYLTDKHDHVMIGLLRTGSPLVMRGANLMNITMSKAAEAAWQEQTTKTEAEQHFLAINIKESDQGYEVWHSTESLSAYNTGQAMAILEIDRSQNPKIPKVKNSCGQNVPAPIEVAWQDTLSDGKIYTFGYNDEVRTTWEELAATAGFLDRNLANYKTMSVASQSQIDRIIDTLRDNLDSSAYERGIVFDLYTETFFKIHRAVDLINEKILNRSGKDGIINPTAISWMIKAMAYFDSVDKSLAVDQNMLEGGRISTQTWEQAVAKFDSIGKAEWDRKIRSLGNDETINKLNAGVSALYNALNAANMVGWNDENAPLEKQKAYEARQKIRQAILELERMPNETYLEPPTSDQITPGADVLHFDPNLVIKQLITYSPEDDLDNGQESIDIFPRGLISVDEDGIGFDFSLKDGEVGYADLHFSHSPIDNGVFSVRGAVFSFVTPKSMLGNIFGSISPIGYGAVERAILISSMSRLRDTSLGEIGHYVTSTDPTGKEIISPLDPTQLISDDLLTTVPVSFRKFIHVAF